MAKLTLECVKQLASKYPADYDDLYFQNIDRGRSGNVDALKALTKWKNAGNNGRPMNFENHLNKKKAWEYFLLGLKDYLTDGKEKLRDDFRNRAPVWAMFWHHILYETPIFDVNTHIAFSFFAEGKSLSRNQARILAGKHWVLYDRYCAWFNEQLSLLRDFDPEIDERTLDRALFMYGKEYHKEREKENERRD